MCNARNSNPIVTNCIFWDSNNTIHNDNSSPKITYCIIKNGTLSIFNGKGNIFDDPKLQSLSNNGNLTHTCALDISSPAIKAGTSEEIVNDAYVVPICDQHGIKRLHPPCIGAFELVSEERIREVSCHLFPNPARDFIYLNFMLSKAGYGTIKIYNEIGEYITTAVQNKHYYVGCNFELILTTELAFGRYFLKFDIDEVTTGISSFIVSE